MGQMRRRGEGNECLSEGEVEANECGAQLVEREGEGARGAKVKGDMAAIKARDAVDDAQAVSDDMKLWCGCACSERRLAEAVEGWSEGEPTMGEAARMREENVAMAAARRQLGGRTALTLESERVKLLDEVAKLRGSSIVRENRRKGEEHMQRRYPLFRAREFLAPEVQCAGRPQARLSAQGRGRR
jgi:hypothetical protein